MRLDTTSHSKFETYHDINTGLVHHSNGGKMVQLVYDLVCGYFFSLFSLRIQKPDYKSVFRISMVQWGSEIQTCPDFKWSKSGWFVNSWVFKWDLKSGNLDKLLHFEKQKYSKSGQKRLTFKWSGTKL